MTDVRLRYTVLLYPEVRRRLTAGDRLADKRIAEQSEGEELLSTLEKDGLEHREFTSRLSELRQAVLGHAESEEQSVNEPLSRALDISRRQELSQAQVRISATERARDSSTVRLYGPGSPVLRTSRAPMIDTMSPHG